MEKDLEELRNLILKTNNIEVLIELITSLPIFEMKAKEIKLYSKRTQHLMKELIREIALKCVDLVQMETDYIEETLNINF